MKYPPTVGLILENWLKENGFDGLYMSGECSCVIGGLVPCGEDPTGCDPGVKMPCDCDEGCNFHIGPKKDYTSTPEPAKVLARASGWIPVHELTLKDDPVLQSFHLFTRNNTSKSDIHVDLTVTERKAENKEDGS